MASLCNILERIKNRVCGTAGIKELCAGFSAEVDESTWDSLEPVIDATAADIALIFGLVPPHYSPTDAGDESATYDASSKATSVIGDEACAIATQAWIDAGCDGGSADHEASATNLYKLKDLLPKLSTQADPT